jgi:hypothetical protein
VVRTGKVDDLNVENLLSKVSRVPKHDAELNAPERSSLDSGMILKKGSLPGRRSFLEIPMQSIVSALRTLRPLPPSIRTFVRWTHPTMGLTMSGKWPMLGMCRGKSWWPKVMGTFDQRRRRGGILLTVLTPP